MMRRLFEGEVGMSLRLRNVLLALAAVALVAAFAWRWLTAREDVPAHSDYRIELEALRALAGSLPGPGPREIRSVLVAEAALPRGVVFAGEPFEPLHQVHQVFQLVWADRSVLIDTAFPREQLAQVAAFADGAGTYHDAGWAAVERALATAEQVFVTHEHFDHLAGASRLAPERADHLRLNAAQLANTAALDESGIPAALRERLRPLEAAPALAVAPGVVLLAAPGHTPGSQMVYVRCQDGREALFLGDVAWNSDQIRNLHYRPRIVTFVLGENRSQVLAQFRALHELVAAHPEVAQVVSHDTRQRTALLASGVLVEGFAE
jgi:glyoxylase-like metal-dependent hydrolase (beta-lactamase superfamily II)